MLLLLSLLTFLIACPGPIINLEAFWDGIPGYPGSGLHYELFEHSRTGHGYLFINTGFGWWYHLVVSLYAGLGGALWGLVLAGTVLACLRRTKGDTLLLAFLVLYYLTTSLSAVRFARYMIPLFPVLCILAARLVTVASLRPTVVRAWAIAGIGVVLLTLVYTTSLVGAMASRDPRDATADYLEQHAPQGATVAFGTTPWYYSAPLSPRFGFLAAPMRADASQTTRFQLRISRDEWDTSTLTTLPDYLLLSNLETMHPLRLKLPATLQFLQAIPASYHPVTFQHDSVWMPFPKITLLPEDLLYILPTLTLYEKR